MRRQARKNWRERKKRKGRIERRQEGAWYRRAGKSRRKGKGTIISDFHLLAARKPRKAKHLSFSNLPLVKPPPDLLD